MNLSMAKSQVPLTAYFTPAPSQTHKSKGKRKNERAEEEDFSPPKKTRSKQTRDATPLRQSTLKVETTPTKSRIRSASVQSSVAEDDPAAQSTHEHASPAGPDVGTKNNAVIDLTLEDSSETSPTRPVKFRASGSKPRSKSRSTPSKSTKGTVKTKHAPPATADSPPRTPPPASPGFGTPTTRTKNVTSYPTPGTPVSRARRPIAALPWGSPPSSRNSSDSRGIYPSRPDSLSQILRIQPEGSHFRFKTPAEPPPFKIPAVPEKVLKRVVSRSQPESRLHGSWISSHSDDTVVPSSQTQELSPIMPTTGLPHDSQSSQELIPTSQSQERELSIPQGFSPKRPTLRRSSGEDVPTSQLWEDELRPRSLSECMSQSESWLEFSHVHTPVGERTPTSGSISTSSSNFVQTSQTQVEKELTLSSPLRLRHALWRSPTTSKAACTKVVEQSLRSSKLPDSAGRTPKAKSGSISASPSDFVQTSQTQTEKEITLGSPPRVGRPLWHSPLRRPTESEQTDADAESVSPAVASLSLQLPEEDEGADRLRQSLSTPDLLSPAQPRHASSLLLMNSYSQQSSQADDGFGQGSEYSQSMLLPQRQCEDMFDDEPVGISERGSNDRESLDNSGDQAIESTSSNLRRPEPNSLDLGQDDSSETESESDEEDELLRGTRPAGGFYAQRASDEENPFQERSQPQDIMQDPRGVNPSTGFAENISEGQMSGYEPDDYADGYTFGSSNTGSSQSSSVPSQALDFLAMFSQNG